MIYTMNEYFRNYALGGAPNGSGIPSSKIEITNNNKLPPTKIVDLIHSRGVIKCCSCQVQV